jgi:UDP-glucose:(heptosyl)LPS alpha-1,3-glucosyltransferase
LDQHGGTERDFYLTANALREFGYEVHLFCSEFGIEPPADTIPHRVRVLPLGRTARLWSFAVRAPALARKANCDVIVGFGRMIGQDVVRCGGGSHRVFLRKLGWSGGWRRRLWQQVSFYHRSVLAIERKQFAPGRFKRIIAVSEDVKRDLIDIYAIPGEKITVLHNGVDQEQFHPSSRERWGAAVRKEWGIPAEAPLALFVGSGFRRKGLERLFDAWESPKLSGAYLLVVGYDARLRRYRARSQRRVAARIVFTGRQSHIERFYGAADVVVLPSVQEAFGNVVLEALASGIPVVVNATVGAAELLRGRLAEGIVRDADDAMELIDKLQQMFQHCHNPELKNEARRVAEAYSWFQNFRKVEACLAEVSREISG